MLHLLLLHLLLLVEANKHLYAVTTKAAIMQPHLHVCWRPGAQKRGCQARQAARAGLRCASGSLQLRCLHSAAAGVQ